MKLLNTKHRLIVTLIALSAMFQSCGVYESYTTSIDLAVESTQNVKVKLSNDTTFEFVRLVKDNEGGLYGIALSNSETSAAFSSRTIPVEGSDELVKIPLNVGEIKGIYMEYDARDKSYFRGIRDALLIDILTDIVIEKLL